MHYMSHHSYLLSFPFLLMFYFAFYFIIQMNEAVDRMEKIVGDSMIPHSDPQSSSSMESGSKILDKTNEKKKASMGTGTTVSDGTVSGIFKVLTVGKYQPYGEEKENHATLTTVKNDINTAKNSSDKSVDKKIDKAKERLLEYEKAKEKRMKMMRETEKEMETKKTKERRKAMNKMMDGKKGKGKESVKKSSGQNVKLGGVNSGSAGVGGGGEKEMRSSMCVHTEGGETNGVEDGRVERMLKFTGNAEATGNSKSDLHPIFDSHSYSCSYYHPHSIYLIYILTLFVIHNLKFILLISISNVIFF